MFEELDIVKEKILSVKDNINVIIQLSFEAIKPLVEDANILQLQQGLRGDGTNLPNYSPVSVYVYGKPAGPIRLYDQGDFYRGITMRAEFDGIVLEGRDIKTQMLELRYGEEILDLTEESIEQIQNDYLIEETQEQLHNYYDNRNP